MTLHPRQAARQPEKRLRRGGKPAAADQKGTLPPEKRAREFKETPDFLKGGTLYPYQLEGLNW